MPEKLGSHHGDRYRRGDAMTQDERRKWLIKYLIREQIRYRMMRIPEDAGEQRALLRALMNTRIPCPVSEEFLRVQDEYLSVRNAERGITDAAILQSARLDSRLCLWQGDITTLKCDAIVNACNSQMLGCFRPMHTCIDNSIHTYAGVELRLKMHEIMRAQGYEEPAGRAKITPGYNLPAKYVLHTVGPAIRWSVSDKDKDLLASCYRSCLSLAAENGVESIAFCCISTGVFRFPQELAAEIALASVRGFLGRDSRISQVIFNVFKDEDLGVYNNMLNP